MKKMIVVAYYHKKRNKIFMVSISKKRGIIDFGNRVVVVNSLRLKNYLQSNAGLTRLAAWYE